MSPVRQRYFPFLEEQNEGSTSLYFLQDLLGPCGPEASSLDSSGCSLNLCVLAGHQPTSPTT